MTKAEAHLRARPQGVKPIRRRESRDETIYFKGSIPPLSELMAGDHPHKGRLLIVWTLRTMPYEEYLQTNHWQEVRERTFQLHGRRCTLGVECSGPLDVHHRTYDNLGDEKPEDTEVLCRKHHEMKHETYRHFVRAQGEQQFNRP